MILDSRRRRYVVGVAVFLISVASIAGMCGPILPPPPSENLEIRDWYDLDAVRDNLGGEHTPMNNLDSTTAGYEELASPTANQGKGWEPVGTLLGQAGLSSFMDTFDGQGYEIRDLFINRPDDETYVGLFGYVARGGVVMNLGVANADVMGGNEVDTVRNSYYVGSGGLPGVWVSALAGLNRERVSNCYYAGSVTGTMWTGGLMGENFMIVINSCFIGSVTGGYEVGGLVGGNDGSVSNSYLIGIVDEVTYPFLSWQS